MSRSPLLTSPVSFADFLLRLCSSRARVASLLLHEALAFER
jgi:hypothetical protein